MNVDTGDAAFDEAHHALLTWTPQAEEHTAELIPASLQSVFSKEGEDWVSTVIGRILPAIRHYREMLKSAISDPFLEFFSTRLHVY